MKLTAHFTTQLKASLGVAEVVIEFQNPPTLSELLSILNERYGEAFSRYALSNDGSLLPSLIVCVNDHQINVADDPILEPESLITFLSAISGG